MSPAPLFFTADGHSVHLEDMARGASIVIIGEDSKITPSSFYSWSIGKAIKKHKSSLWTATSEPESYREVWNNPSILKLVPSAFAQVKCDNKFIAHAPFTFYFRRHEEFSPQNFLFEDTVYSPTGPEFVLFTIIRLAYIVGFRNLYFTGITTSSRVKDVLKNMDQVFVKNRLNLYDIDSNLPLKKTNLDVAIAKCIL